MIRGGWGVRKGGLRRGGDAVEEGYQKKTQTYALWVGWEAQAGGTGLVVGGSALDVNVVFPDLKCNKMQTGIY